MILKDTDSFGLAGEGENADVEEAEPSGVETHEREGVLPVAGAALPLAEGTAGIELPGEAERTIT